MEKTLGIVRYRIQFFTKSFCGQRAGVAAILKSQSSASCLLQQTTRTASTRELTPPIRLLRKDLSIFAGLSYLSAKQVIVRSLKNGEQQRAFLSLGGTVCSRGLYELPRNEKIRARTVVLIDEDGNKLATIPLQQALQAAKDKQLELVELQNQKGTRAAVCRMYSRKTLYDAEKKHKHSPQGNKVKELTITGHIAPQDLQWKTKKIHGFLEHGFSVKLSISRKPYHKISDEEKLEIVKKVVDGVKEVGVLDGQPKSVGSLVLRCTLKPVSQQSKAQTQGDGSETA
ncbi:predicted protein [Nematostella vectensis]|uniref:Translation initiation factor 3 N-terminal domain-containing protein n=1 Tax=Nematostella vectensis TaxID=45351 RepID=A7RNF7_NEMVE|nr:predicted protein [Nematostella vectensis]|eukprot:XP_001639116.1 predicted protein [Nematostella vectensis]